MQKIISRQEKAKKTRKNQFIIGILLIALMVFSTLGFAFSGKTDDSNSEEVDYQEIKFTKQDTGYWSFNIEGYDFTTKYNPKEVEDIPFFSYSTLQDYAGKPLYFVGNYPEPALEIGRNLNAFVSRTNNACLEGEECSGDYPIKNCTDNILIIREIDYESDSKESVYQEENCLIITASLQNQSIYADAALFKILGIN